MDLSFLDAVGGVRVAAGVVAAVVVLLVVSWLMKPKAPERKFQARTCGSCGWQGNVSAFKPKCPRCANSL